MRWSPSTGWPTGVDSRPTGVAELCARHPGGRGVAPDSGRARARNALLGVTDGDPYSAADRRGADARPTNEIALSGVWRALKPLSAHSRRGGEGGAGGRVGRHVLGVGGHAV